MKSAKPTKLFDFSKAITQPFSTPEGKKFVWRLVFWMSVFYSVLYLIFIPFYLRLYPALMEYNWLNMQSFTNGGQPPDSSLFLTELGRSSLVFIVVMIGWWVIFASGEVALYRKTLRGQEHPRMPLRFGREELRVMLAQFCVGMVVFAVYLFGLFFVMIIGTLFTHISSVLAAVFLTVGIIALLCLLIYIPVRLAPAAALTVYTGKTKVTSARFTTKSRFWNMFFAYLVVGVAGYIFVTILSLIGILIMTGDSDIIALLSGMSPENPRAGLEALAPRLKNPIIMAFGVLWVIAQSTLVCLWWICYAGIGSYAVKLKSEEDPTGDFV